MKYIYIAALALGLGFVSCNDDFVDQFPVDKINDANYWNTAQDLRLYTNQFYTDGVLNRTGSWGSDNSSDNQAPSTRESFIWNEVIIPSSGGGWAKDDWKTIRACNYFLQHYQRVSEKKENINPYLGEILLFKSMFYFEKVKRFGNVPWLTRDLNTGSAELYNPRDSRKVVMDSICENLDRAIKLLPETTKDNRLTKYAALAFKSRVALFEGTFRKYHKLGDEEKMLRQAADAAFAVIDSKKFDLYSTGAPDEDYRQFFILQDMSDIKEAIFYVAYKEDKRMHNGVRGFGGSTGFTKDFAESFLCSDGLPTALSPLYKGDQKYMDEFENRDLRMRQSIHTADQPVLIDVKGEIHYTKAPEFTTDFFTGYRMFKRYSPLARDFEYDRCTIDDCIFRYAEVLLNYAEAKAELNECNGEVLKLSINKLRSRVGMPDMPAMISFTDPNWPKWEAPISPLLNEIRRERRVELAAEGFRWDDLRRWKAGKLLEEKKTYLGARDPEGNNILKELYPNNTRKWVDKLYLHPIPTDELNYNPNLLPQNSGW